MPGPRRVYLNDNVRTAHLKCSDCRTQIYLIKIEQDEDGAEVRTFGCPHCAHCKLIRLAPRLNLRGPVQIHSGQ
jgi:DNA-directed RNA polymerase subunit RPC12/RpoP